MDANQQKRINISEIAALMDPESTSKYVWLLMTTARIDDSVYKLMLDWRDSTAVGRQFVDTYIAQELHSIIVTGTEQRKIRGKP